MKTVLMIHNVIHGTFEISSLNQESPFRIEEHLMLFKSLGENIVSDSDSPRLFKFSKIETQKITLLMM